jgi:hypothetical protein
MKEFMRWTVMAFLAAISASAAVHAATARGYSANPEFAAFVAVLFGFGAFGIYRTVPPKKMKVAE